MAAQAKPYVHAAFGSEEKLYLLKVFLVIPLLRLSRPLVRYHPLFITLLLVSLAGAALLMKARRDHRPLRHVLRDVATWDAARPAAEGRRRVPAATLALAAFMVLAYYAGERSVIRDFEFIRHNYVFLPLSGNWWNILVSPLIGLFLHGGALSLWTGVAFLTVFGPPLEKRIGGRKTLIIFLVSGLWSKILTIFIGLAFFGRAFHGWGATPAVAGIMGAFLIRCHFTRLSLHFPRSRLLIHPLLPLWGFFLLDLNAGFVLLPAAGSAIGFWTHGVALVTGVLLALGMDLQTAAAEEKFIEEHAEAADDAEYYAAGESFLRAELELNPDNERAMLGLARLKTTAGLTEGGAMYDRAIRSALRSSPERAARIYREYLKADGRPLEPELLYRLAGILQQEGDAETAALSLELAIEDRGVDPQVLERSFLQLITILAEKGKQDAALFRLRQFASRFPHSPLLSAAEEKCRFPE